jgi:hypothetical protein
MSEEKPGMAGRLGLVLYRLCFAVAALAALLGLYFFLGRDPLVSPEPPKA